jgi:hypothetical protein
MNRARNNVMSEKGTMPQGCYAVFGKISVAISPDLPVTIATAMLFSKSRKLTH